MVNLISFRCSMGLFSAVDCAGVWLCNLFLVMSEVLMGIWRLLWSSDRVNDWDAGGDGGDGSGDGVCGWAVIMVLISLIVYINKCDCLLDVLVMMWSAIMVFMNYERAIIVLICIRILSCFRRRFLVVWRIPGCFVSVWTRRRKNLRMKRSAKSQSHDCLLGHSGNATCIQPWQYL